MARACPSLSFSTSNAVTYQAANAAFVFKEWTKRENYEKELPNLVKFYQVIHDGMNVRFDTQKPRSWIWKAGLFTASAININRLTRSLTACGTLLRVCGSV